MNFAPPQRETACPAMGGGQRREIMNSAKG